MVDAVDRVRGLLVDGWARLLSGSIGYIATQVALLYVSLHSVGLAPAVSTVLMAAAIERLGTLVPITPGGTGIAEIGTIAWLVAAGLPPVQVVAGVVLYRVFLFALEIPVGAVLLGGWAWWRTSRSVGPGWEHRHEDPAPHRPLHPGPRWHRGSRGGAGGAPGCGRSRRDRADLDAGRSPTVARRTTPGRSPCCGAGPC